MSYRSTRVLPCPSWLFRSTSRGDGARNSLHCTNMSMATCLGIYAAQNFRPTRSSLAQGFNDHTISRHTPPFAESRLTQVRHSKPSSVSATSSCTYYMDDVHDGACPFIDPWSTEQRSKRSTPQSQIVNPVRQRSHLDSKAQRSDLAFFLTHLLSSLATDSRTGSGAKTLVSRNSKFLRTLTEGVCAIPEEPRVETSSLDRFWQP